MDDEPEFINNYKRIIEKEGIDLSVDIATTIAEASKKLATGIYNALIADCRMDLYDRSQNGVSFVLDVNKNNRCLPTYLYSAYLHDAAFIDAIGHTNVVDILDKNEQHTLPLSKDQMFQNIITFATNHFQSREFHPERISFNDYVRNPEKYSDEIDQHWTKHQIWIVKELERSNCVWGIVCGTRLVDKSNDILDYPNEEQLTKLGAKHKLIPFAYSLPQIPEESTWNPTTSKNDYYPTLKIKIKNVSLEDDFDTGAYQTYVSDEVVTKGIFDFIRHSGNSKHLGQKFQYFTKKVPIEIISEDGERKTVEVAVSVVRDWKDSSFVRINPHRQILIGRDLLRASEIRIELDAKTRTSKVYI